MANYVITSTDNSFEVSKDGYAKTFPKDIFILQLNELNPQELTFFNKHKSQNEYIVYTDTDFINVNGTTSWANAEELKTALRTIIFLTSSDSSTQGGFIDYNDNTGNISLTANTWVDIPNDGQGPFSNSSYKPSGVSELIDVSTGYIDTSELSLGDSILIRNDYTITPSTNNSLLEFRYELGNGSGVYNLQKIVGRLDSGSGVAYRFSLEPDLIYMGDTNTKDNPIKLQVKLSSNGVLNNAGSVIQVLKR